MKIVLLDNETLYIDSVANDLKQFGEVEVYQTTKTKEELVSRIKDVDIVLTNKVVLDKEAMDVATKLKLICILATGMNNVDLVYAAEKNITVKNVAGYSTDSVAQHTFTCLLGLVGKLAQQDAFVKQGQYAVSGVFTHLENAFWELKGKQIGIIGMGNIGQKVAEIANAFGMEVCYFSSSGKNNAQKYKQLSLEELLKSSDVISIHAPLHEKTKNLIAQTQLEMMKSSAILVNMGRGGIVNELDLAQALQNNTIAGACLDVFEQEPLPLNSPLLDSEIANKLILTPHVAWASKEARAKLWQLSVQNVKTFLANV